MFSPAVGAEAVLPRGERASHRSALSCCAAQALHGQAWLSDGLWNLSRPGASLGPHKAPTQAVPGGSLSWEDSLEKGTATHSSILAGRIPWTV